MKPNPYQLEIKDRLEKHFAEVLLEWSPFLGDGRLKYSPCVDIAIGPINDKTKESSEMIKVYDDLLRPGTNPYILLQECHLRHVSNLKQFLGNEYVENAHASWAEALEANQNARCLLAIEIENRTSVKHMMGSIVNASSLGRFGIGIGYSEKAIKTFLRHIQYFTFLKSKDKGSYDTANFMVLTKEQMLNLLEP